MIFSGSGKKFRIRLRIRNTGKKRTNHVCRQLHVLDETFVMNACKEDCCYVALDWAEDVRIAKRKGAENTLARDYVLPGMIHSIHFIRVISS
jgi:actin-related protein 6